jgi:chromosome segregation ATPase
MTDEIKVLASKVDSMSGTLERVLSAIEKQANTAEQLVRAMERHDAHSEQQAQINQEVQLALKDVGGRLRQVELTQAKAVIHDQSIAALKNSIAALEVRVRDVEQSTLVNTTKITPIWSVIIRVAGGIALAGVGFLLGTK